MGDGIQLSGWHVQQLDQFKELVRVYPLYARSARKAFDLGGLITDSLISIILK